LPRKGARGRTARLGAVVLGGCAAALAPTAHAQHATVDELIVTGTRLPLSSATAGGPAVSVDRADLERAGHGTLEAYINTLPQVVPSFGAAANNPSADGAAFVDLRGLGEARNLVLIDGRRVIGANAAGSVDLNAIPIGLVDRIEVTTGGASAVYGADAVAGVVNLLLRRSYDGVELTGRTAVTEQGDGRQHQLDLTLGRSFARGRLMAGAGWLDRAEVGKGARSFSSQAAGPSSFFPSGSYVVAGPNQPSQAAVNAVFGRYGVAAGAVPRNGGFGGFGFNEDGTLFSSGQRNSPIDVQNFRGSRADQTGLFPDVYAFNFEPFNKLILPLERWNAAVIGDLEVTDKVELYGQALYARYTAQTSLAPTPAPTDTNPLFPQLVVPLFVIPVTHPLIPADLAQLLASRTGDTPPIPGAGASEGVLYRLRTADFGARTIDYKVETRHVVGGVRIDLPGSWRADAYAAVGRYTRRETQGGLLSVVRLQQLLNSPTAGRDLCEGGFNPFGVELGPACLDFVRTEGVNRTRITHENFVVSAAGPLFELPAGQVTVAVGAEHRATRFRLTPDPSIRAAEVAGFSPVLALSGRLRFRDLYGEAAIPLWAGDAVDQPFAEAVVGARISDDPDGAMARSYKAELSIRPGADVRLRGTYQRAVRAPNVDERYAPVVNGFATAADPCSAASAQRTAQVLALCQAQALALGLPASFATGFVQFGLDVGAVTGGNPDLKSERADTFTLGLVWEPDLAAGWVRDVQFSADAYDIDLKGAIGAGDPQVVINACYNIDGANPGYDAQHPACRALSRTGVDFSLFGLDARQVNQARIRTSGIDVTGGVTWDLAELWRRPLLGSLETRVLVSWLGRFEEQASAARPAIKTEGAASDSSTGYQSLPRWKARADLVWRSGDVEAGVAARYTSRMSHRISRLDPTAAVSGPGAATYVDLSLRWRVRDRAELRGGVVNAFDRGPELYFPAVDANTEPSTFDVLGRRFWVSLTVRH
jgi:iron complex outermembrane receptor protein